MNIAWAGVAYEHLYTILEDGRTYRLDRDANGDRYWSLVATIPLFVLGEVPARIDPALDNLPATLANPGARSPSDTART